MHSQSYSSTLKFYVTFETTLSDKLRTVVSLYSLILPEQFENLVADCYQSAIKCEENKSRDILNKKTRKLHIMLNIDTQMK